MSNYEKIEFDGKVYKRYLNLKGPKRNYFLRSGSEYLHRAVWIFHNGDVPTGCHIHHKDGDSLNNSIENLKCVTPGQHCKAHSSLAKTNPDKDIYVSRRNWHKSELGTIHHKEIWKNRKKIEVNCHVCGNVILKFKCGIGRYICIECRKDQKRQLARQDKKPKVIKEKKEFTPIKCSCEMCNKEMEQKTKREKRFCSKACKTKARNYSGLDNVERNCLICYKEFTINRYSKTKTCSSLCRSECIRIAMRSEGEKFLATKAVNMP